MDTYFFCQICNKDVSCSHGGSSDLVRHCASASHSQRLREKRKQPTISGFVTVKNSSVDEKARIAELKFTGFLAEHNLPLASADHLTSLVRECFPDSKIAQSYACSRTKASCILNGAICPDLKQSLVEEMKTFVFSLSTDGSNDQNLEKMNPLTVRIFDINQHKVVTKFFDMCLSKSATAVGIFSSIDNAMAPSNIPWDNCVALLV